MKIRQGFVSNSSSSSFVITQKLTSKQILLISNHIEIAEKIKNLHPDVDFGYTGDYDQWNVEVGSHGGTVSTTMDNFNMEAYLNFFGISFKREEY